MIPKVVIFDLDGTLTESKQPLTQEIAEALKQLLDKMPVAVMSGADFPQFESQFLSFLPKAANLSNLYLFPTSAAECLSYKDNKWFQEYDYSFTPEEKKTIIKAIKEALQNTGLAEGTPSYGERIQDRGEQITWSALGQDAPPYAKSQWDPDHKKRHVLRQELSHIIPEFEIGIGGATSIDITRKGISKEDGIFWLKKRLEIPANEMLYIGDALFPEGNDAEVKKTTVETRSVFDPKDTYSLIQEILKNKK
jgi:HAD superfamily hydrolase (TIGR01484 family)